MQFSFRLKFSFNLELISKCSFQSKFSYNLFKNEVFIQKLSFNLD